MCNQTHKRDLFVPVPDFNHRNVASDSKEMSAPCKEKTTGDDVNAQSDNLNEHSAGEAVFRHPQPLSTDTKYTDQLLGNSRICLVMELLTGGTLVVSAQCLPTILLHSALSRLTLCTVPPLVHRIWNTPNMTESGRSLVVTACTQTTHASAPLHAVVAKPLRGTWPTRCSTSQSTCTRGTG